MQLRKDDNIQQQSVSLSRRGVEFVVDGNMVWEHHRALQECIVSQSSVAKAFARCMPKLTI